VPKEVFAGFFPGAAGLAEMFGYFKRTRTWVPIARPSCARKQNRRPAADKVPGVGSSEFPCRKERPTRSTVIEKNEQKSILAGADKLVCAVARKTDSKNKKEEVYGYEFDRNFQGCEATSFWQGRGGVWGRFFRSRLIFLWLPPITRQANHRLSAFSRRALAPPRSRFHFQAVVAIAGGLQHFAGLSRKTWRLADRAVS